MSSLTASSSAVQPSSQSFAGQPRIFDAFPAVDQFILGPDLSAATGPAAPTDPAASLDRLSRDWNAGYDSAVAGHPLPPVGSPAASQGFDAGLRALSSCLVSTGIPGTIRLGETAVGPACFFDEDQPDDCDLSEMLATRWDADDLPANDFDAVADLDAARDAFEDVEPVPPVELTDRAWNCGWTLGYLMLPAMPPDDYTDAETLAWVSGFKTGKARGVADALDDRAKWDEVVLLDREPGADWHPCEVERALGHQVYQTEGGGR
jgi:hypothetical protein